MSKRTENSSIERTSAAIEVREGVRQDTGFSVVGIMRRLPNVVLVPGVIALFALLLTDLAVADPLPIVDEAAIFWAMINGLKVIGERRKASKLASRLDPELEVVADVMPEPVPAPGQPLAV